jgi:diaminopimelate epimerase
MILSFYKYQGAGNDFVMIDNRNLFLQKTQNDLIRELCHRRFGIGADGVIFIQNHNLYDFEMIYFNADGFEGSMCGNGGRCAVAFAQFLGIIDKKTTFLAVDGVHEALITAEDWVELKMSPVLEVEKKENDYILNTGSPHYVQFVPSIAAVNVFEAGRAIRYNDRFRAEGINVNFVEITEEGLSVATYERGVEDETLACGTGVTACALAFWLKNQKTTDVSIKAKGGQLSVRFLPKKEEQFDDIWLCGGAKQVFFGKILV